MNQSFPCRYKYILQEKISNIFLEVFGVLIGAQTTRKKHLRQHNFFSKDLVKIKIIPLQS
jgi:hypothetical protein